MTTVSEQMTEAHEERLQRLETGMQGVATATALSAQKLDHLTEKLAEGFESIHKRLDAGNSQFEAQEQRLQDHGSKLGKLQELEEARVSRLSTIKKAALPLLAAAAGVIATKSAENIWSWLTKVIH